VDKLVLIDGNAILHRAFHALPPLTNKRGEPINAVYGLVSMLLRVITDLKPTHIAVCFDTPEPTFRNKVFKDYQAQRPQTLNELISQFEKARRVIKAFGIPYYEKPGFEADDLIGTIANRVKEETVIVTGDRDILQLVTPRVKVYMPVVGMSEGKLMGEEEVLTKMGIKASLIDDYKALVGDPSDNYTGVPGIGPKTAIKLLDEFGTLDSIYKNLSKIPEKTAKLLREGRNQSKMSKKLATIVKDVPLNIKIEDCAKWDVDSKAVLDLFAEYGFKTLTERVKKVGKELDMENQLNLL
jgi:DNA polymerase-1